MSTDSRDPRLEVNNLSDRTVIRFLNCTNLNEFTSDRVGQLLAGVPLDKCQNHVVLDLDLIQYLTSTILGHLIVLHKRVATRGGRLSLENVKPAVRDVFRVTLLDQVLNIQPSS
jgi:anti-anti-sigma factor